MCIRDRTRDARANKKWLGKPMAAVTVGASKYGGQERTLEHIHSCCLLYTSNTKPVTDSEPIVTYIKTKAKEVGHVNVYPIGSISKGLEGKELAEIGELKNAGAVAISDDGRPVVE